MEIITSILSIALVIGLPVFFVYKLFKLLSTQLEFSREQKSKTNNKQIQYLDLQMLELQSKIDFYKNATDESPLRSKGGGYNGHSNKSVKVDNRAVSR